MSEEISREEIAALLARESEDITRERARDTLRNAAWLGTDEERERIEKAVELLCGEPCEELPSAQHEPSEITDEQAIRHLQSTGWMHNHDREMYESGLREKLADDSGSYDSLIPCEDAISRQTVLDLAVKIELPDSQTFSCISPEDVEALPSVTPKQRTAWIPVSEPPKKLGTYLIQTDGEPYMCQCRWTDVNPFWTDLKTKPHWNIFDLPQYSKVVAWMPLTKPYVPQESEVSDADSN